LDQNRQKHLYLLLLCLGIVPFLINGWVNSLIHASAVAYWSFELVSWVLIPVLVFSVAGRNGLSLADLGLDARIFGQKNLLLVVVLCVIFCPVNLWVYKHTYKFFEALLPSAPYFQYETIVPTRGVMKVVVSLYFSLSAGIVEELYFRGFIHRVSRFFARPAVVYMVFSPLVFAMVHWEGGPSNLLATYVFGLFNGIAFLAMRNLWPLVFGHIFTDYVWFN